MKFAVEMDNGTMFTLTLISDDLSAGEQAFVLATECKRLVRFLAGEDFLDDPDNEKPALVPTPTEWQKATTDV